MATFSEIFNARLGNQIGVQSQNHDPRNTAIDPKAAAQSSARRLAIAEVLAERAGKSSFDMSGGGGNAPVGGIRPATKELLLHTADWKPNEGGFLNTLKGVGTDLADVGTRGLDLISRPAYAAFEGAKEMSQTMNEGENTLQSLDNIVGGVASGLAGKEKTGFGEIIEENSKRGPSNHWNPLMRLGEGLGEGTDNNTKKWLKRGGGLFGEVVLDPLNAIAGSAKVVGEADDVAMAAKKALHEVIQKEGLSPSFNKAKLAPTGEVVETTRKLTKADIDAGTVGKVGDVVPSTRKLMSNQFVNANRAYKEVDEVFEDVLLEVSAGSSKGRTLGAQMLPGTLGNRTAERVRGIVFEDLDASVAKFAAHVDGTKPLTMAELTKMKKDPRFQEWHDNLLIEINKGRPKHPYKTFDEMMADVAGTGKSNVDTAMRAATSSTKASLDKTIERINVEMIKSVRGKIYNAPAISVGGKQVVFKRLGKAYSTQKQGILQSPGIKGLSHAKQFPGRGALIAQKIRSGETAGLAGYEAFHKAAQDAAKGLTKAERIKLSEHILKETVPSDPRLAQAMAFIKGQDQAMFLDEIDYGVRAADDKMVDNYLYMYYKGRRFASRSVVDAQKKAVKEHIGRTGKMPQWLIRDAKAKGLRPEEDAFKGLLLRKMESNRKLTRAAFKEDLIDNYGVLANNLTKNSMHRRGLVNFNGDLPNSVKEGMKDGDEWFLPDDIHEMYKNFNKLLDSSLSEDTEGFVRLLDKLTRMFKASATIPYPGFHIRNAIGDIFMSHLDGVPFKAYSDIKRLSIAEKNPNKIAEKIKIGRQEFTLAEIKKIFDENASSGGFQSVDIGTDNVLAAKLNPAAIPNAMREASQNREDFFRFAHFFHAFKDELNSASRKFKNDEVALRKAIETSTYRVNKSLFDYGALTKLERNTIRRIIPFYTYSRKVVPALLEAMFLNPGQMSKTNRFFIENEDAPMQDMLIPGYQREIGYAKLTDEEEPWLVGAQFLPTDAMRNNMDFSSDADMFRNILGQSNPFLKMAGERAGGTKYFNEAPTGGAGSYYAGALAPPVGPIRDLLGGWDPAGNIIGEGNKDGAERFTAGRFGLGLPVTKLREDQQTSSLFNLENAVEEKIATVNAKLEENGYRMYLSKRKDGTTFRINNIKSGKVVASSQSPEYIEELAQRYIK